MSTRSGAAVPYDPFAEDDGAYVLGALVGDERTAFVRHLAKCGACRARVAEVENLPALLVTAGADDFAVGSGDDPVDRPPDTLLPGLLLRAGAERRRRRVLMAGLSALAAACLVALAVVLWPSGATSTGRPAPRALVPVVASPVHADVSLVATTWGTELDLRCRYSAGVVAGRPYQLIVSDWHSHQQKLGTWLLPPGKEVTFSAATALRPSQIGWVEVTLIDGTPILRLSN